MTVSILGCGWFGMSLAKALARQGISVKASTTTLSKLAQLSAANLKGLLVNIGPAGDSIVDPDFFYCDTLVIANNVKMTNRDEYIIKVQQTLALIRQHRIKRVLFISSTSVYGDPNCHVNESTLPAPESASAKMLYAAERLMANTASFQCTIIRFAGLVGPDRDPALFFAGRTNIPNGLAPVNLVHLEDCTAITGRLILQQQSVPILNIVSPDHPSKWEFYTIAAQQRGLAIPLFLKEKRKWKIVESNVYNSAGNFRYTIDNWMNWLATGD